MGILSLLTPPPPPSSLYSFFCISSSPLDFCIWNSVRSNWNCIDWNAFSPPLVLMVPDVSLCMCVCLPRCMRVYPHIFMIGESIHSNTHSHTQDICVDLHTHAHNHSLGGCEPNLYFHSTGFFLHYVSAYIDFTVRNGEALFFPSTSSSLPLKYVTVIACSSRREQRVWMERGEALSCFTLPRDPVLAKVLWKKKIDIDMYIDNGYWKRIHNNLCIFFKYAPCQLPMRMLLHFCPHTEKLLHSHHYFPQIYSFVLLSIPHPYLHTPFFPRSFCSSAFTFCHYRH